MTRMNGYFLHECPSCGQLHKRARYASVSIYVPNDLVIESNRMISCKSCGVSSKFEAYSMVSEISLCQPDISWLYGEKPILIDRIKKFFTKGKRVNIEYPYLI